MCLGCSLSPGLSKTAGLNLKPITATFLDPYGLGLKLQNPQAKSPQAPCSWTPAFQPTWRVMGNRFLMGIIIGVIIADRGN